LAEVKSGSVANALKAAQEILTDDGKDLRSFLYRDIVMNALNCRNLDILDLKMIDRVVAEFQHAACVFKPYRSVRKVSIFG
jgi:sulfur relay (sulfurtransferase) complex TusBCD TusD component (DsrE family)